MNKQEAIELLKNNTYKLFGSENEGVPLDIAIGTVQLINEPAKVVVPKVAIDYYEAYKDKLTGFDEWFGDFWDDTFLEEFPQAEQLSEWLYDNDKYTNLQRELALATLIVNGPDAVEIEQEQLYRVEFPTGQQLYKNHPNGSSKEVIVIKFAHYAEKDGHFTKRELKEAGFGWVFDCEGVKVEEVE